MMFPNLPAVGVHDTSWVVGKRRTEAGNVGERALQQLDQEEESAFYMAVYSPSLSS